MHCSQKGCLLIHDCSKLYNNAKQTAHTLCHNSGLKRAKCSA
jgi:hypothetical protein